jgi:hypothetical protein
MQIPMKISPIIPVPPNASPASSPAADAKPAPPAKTDATDGPSEIGGPSGPEPTRYGDWEKNGRCTDF